MVMNGLEKEFARLNPDLYLEITERSYLRGIEDVLGEQKYAEYVLDRFIEDRCSIDSHDGTVRASYLYGRFLEWFNRMSVVRNIPKMTWFGRQMAMRFEKTKKNGSVYYKGLTIR